MIQIDIEHVCKKFSHSNSLMKHHWATTDNACHLVVAFGKLNPRRIHTFSTSPLLHDGLWKSGAILERIFLQRRAWRKGAYHNLITMSDQFLLRTDSGQMAWRCWTLLHLQHFEATKTDRQSWRLNRISRTCDETLPMNLVNGWGSQASFWQ